MVKNKEELKNPANEKIKYDSESSAYGKLIDQRFISSGDLSSHVTGKEAYEHDRKLKDDPERNFTPLSVLEKKNILEKRDK